MEEISEPQEEIAKESSPQIIDPVLDPLIVGAEFTEVFADTLKYKCMSSL